jgi:predicted RNA methylase
VAIARNAFAHLPARFRDQPLLDVGCGRGRLLVVASDAGFSPLVGVDVDRDHVLAARRATLGRADVVVADAATWTIPDHIGVVAMFNPFGAATMADLVANLRSSLERRPRPLAIVYVNPVEVRTLEAGGFTLGWVGEDAAILTSG